MSKLKTWRFFAGLIIFFAGLDVTLLLSHLSRFIGVALLFAGLLLMITAHPKLSKRTKDALPDKFVSLFSPETLSKLRYLVFFVLSVFTVILFFRSLNTLIPLIVLLVAPELAMRALKKEDTDNTLLSMEFQMFVFVSTVLYINFDAVFGYRDPPAIFPLVFLVAAWIIEGIYLFGRLAPAKPIESVKQPIEEEGPYLSERFIHMITFNGRFKPFIPVVGAAMIGMVFVFNLFITGGLSLGSHDGATLLLGVALLAYNRIPDKYSFERDFTMLFLAFLFLILVLPITILAYTSGPMTEASNSPVIYHMLARPTAWLLRSVGIPARAAIKGEWVIIGMPMAANSFYIDYVYREVLIGLSCTGLYSVTIFISAFLAFVMVHFKKMTFQLSLFMVLGIIASWIANILRMFVIMLMGYHYGSEAMMWTHNNAGIFIFMVWIALFWGVMFKFFDIPVGRD